MYLRNIPVSRYSHLIHFKGMTGIYYNPGNQNLSRIASEIDLLTQYNPCINVYKYFDIKQI